MTPQALFTCAFIPLLFSCAFGNDLARGWGDNIEWKTFEDGLQAAKEQNKPLMLVIHKTWCGACKALKPQFADSKDIKELSKNFVMVHTEDDEEPKGDQYVPDGGYIPRILFLDPEGTVRKEFYNVGGHDEYKYYYFSPDLIVETMKRVMEKIHSPSEEDKEKTVSDEL